MMIKIRMISFIDRYGLEDVNIKLIDRVSDESALLDKEGQWAYRLRCIKPQGLNRSDFFFSQGE